MSISLSDANKAYVRSKRKATVAAMLCARLLRFIDTPTSLLYFGRNIQWPYDDIETLRDAIETVYTVCLEYEKMSNRDLFYQTVRDEIAREPRKDFNDRFSELVDEELHEW